MLSKICNKTILLTALAGFIVFSLYGFVVHGLLLQDTYNSLPSTMWRNEADSEALMHWIFIAYILMAWMLAVLRPDYVKNLVCGLQYGAAAGVFLGSVNLINYAIQPMTIKVTIITFVADVVMIALVMAVMAVVANKLADKETE